MDASSSEGVAGKAPRGFPDLRVWDDYAILDWQGNGTIKVSLGSHWMNHDVPRNASILVPFLRPGTQYVLHVLAGDEGLRRAFETLPVDEPFNLTRDPRSHSVDDYLVL